MPVKESSQPQAASSEPGTIFRLLIIMRLY
jgi:hypothetical protein